MKSILNSLIPEKININGRAYGEGDQFKCYNVIYEIRSITDDFVIYARLDGPNMEKPKKTLNWNTDIEPYP